MNSLLNTHSVTLVGKEKMDIKYTVENLISEFVINLDELIVYL
jgi:hypothetical protein